VEVEPDNFGYDLSWRDEIEIIPALITDLSYLLIISTEHFFRLLLCHCSMHLQQNIVVIAMKAISVRRQLAYTRDGGAVYFTAQVYFIVFLLLRVPGIS